MPAFVKRSRRPQRTAYTHIHTRTGMVHMWLVWYTLKAPALYSICTCTISTCSHATCACGPSIIQNARTAQHTCAHTHTHTHTCARRHGAPVVRALHSVAQNACAAQRGGGREGHGRCFLLHQQRGALQLRHRQVTPWVYVCSLWRHSGMRRAAYRNEHVAGNDKGKGDSLGPRWLLSVGRAWVCPCARKLRTVLHV